MSKANRRFRGGLTYHRNMEEYKIPIEDRKEFMGCNKYKWVNLKKWLKYLGWKKHDRR